VGAISSVVSLFRARYSAAQGRTSTNRFSRRSSIQRITNLTYKKIGNLPSLFELKLHLNAIAYNTGDRVSRRRTGNEETKPIPLPILPTLSKMHGIIIPKMVARRPAYKINGFCLRCGYRLNWFVFVSNLPPRSLRRWVSR